jgi:ABC-type multidrug transport system fused ATPase/permease subunit
MLGHSRYLIAAMVMIVLSSGTLGAGMLGAKPVMDAILGEAKGLDQLATTWNEGLRNSETIPWSIGSWLTIPEFLRSELPSDPFVSLVWIMSTLAALTIFGAATTFLQGYLGQTVVNRTVTSIRQRAFHAALRSPLRSLISSGPTDTISRIVNDTSVLTNGLSILLSKAVLQVAKGVAGLAVALAYNWRVTLVALAITPLLYQVIRKLGKKIKRASQATLQSQSGLYSAAAESLQAHRVVKVHAAERYESGRFHRMNREMLRELNKLRTAKAIASPLTEMLTVLMLCGMVLVLGRFIINKEISPAGFVLSIASLAVAGASLKPLTGIINDIQSSAPAADRLMQLLELEPEPGHPRPGEKLPRLQRHCREIAFENVHLSYPGALAPALQGVTLTVPHGKRVAIVGGNGSGKTTLLSLVPRLFDPDKGRVLVDGTDIRTVSVRSLREQIGVVTQEVTLFRGTIRSNILYGAEGAVSDERMIAAAKLARAHDFISALASGYDTPVTEQGLNLSGGQRQRLSIARALLRDPSILIMDEATSMIDAENEMHLAQAIGEFGAGRTCLIVAHRQATILSCDHIFVMDNGRLADHGTHKDLLERCDAYRALWRGHEAT